MTKNMGERMATIETRTRDIDSKIDNHVHEQREDFDKVFQKLDKLNTKFAGKWVEKVALGTLISLLAGMAMTIFTIVAGG